MKRAITKLIEYLAKYECADALDVDLVTMIITSLDSLRNKVPN